MTKEVLATWEKLKTKITNLTFLKSNQALIKEALELHLNQASTLLSEQFQPGTRQRLRIPDDWVITNLTEPTVPEHNSDGTISQEWREYFSKQEWNAYLSQKAKNEQIVTDCKKLLVQLENS